MKQGLSDSSWLFVVAVNYLLKDVVKHWDDKNYGIAIDNKSFHHLAITDDILLMSHNKDELMHMAKQAVEALQRGGLTPNFEKFGWATNATEDTTSLQLQLQDQEPFAIKRGDNDQMVWLGTQMTINPMLSWDR